MRSPSDGAATEFFYCVPVSCIINIVDEGMFLISSCCNYHNYDAWHDCVFFFNIFYVFLACQWSWDCWCVFWTFNLWELLSVFFSCFQPRRRSSKRSVCVGVHVDAAKVWILQCGATSSLFPCIDIVWLSLSWEWDQGRQRDTNHSAEVDLHVGFYKISTLASWLAKALAANEEFFIDLPARLAETASVFSHIFHGFLLSLPKSYDHLRVAKSSTDVLSALYMLWLWESEEIDRCLEDFVSLCFGANFSRPSGSNVAKTVAPIENEAEKTLSFFKRHQQWLKKPFPFH